MSEQPTRTAPPSPSIEDFDSIISFITARMEPLRRNSHNSDMEPALVGFGDLVHSIYGAAEAKMRNGQRATFEFHQLHLAARWWRDHPDYPQKWRA